MISLQKDSGKLAANTLLIVSVKNTLNDYAVLGSEAEILIAEIEEVVTNHHPFVKEHMYIKSAPDESPVRLSEQVCRYMHTHTQIEIYILCDLRVYSLNSAMDGACQCTSREREIKRTPCAYHSCYIVF